MEMCFLLFLAWICKNLFPCCPVQRFCLSECGGPQIFKGFRRGTFFTLGKTAWEQGVPNLNPAMTNSVSTQQPRQLLLRSASRSTSSHSSPWALDPPTDPHSGREPPAKLSSPEEALTYASVAFKISEEKTDHLTKKHSTPLDSVVYAPVKVTDSLHLSNEA
ncbi:transmembrane protein C1orf162 homolog isoform X2 [Ursus americanus]|uniref:Transmembrane protein C1orf162 homolog isoform X2 n=1 Tax=Ursus maritimus TaxID=29073 RepID=A0A384D688_URSMA|nr:transmembrane protein C1orf162 homolog isoform X2 [Ursus maritimus]XP_045657467.1 transmembrane protein C1orf162 homolog isoform X2 [Ursus americanus]